MHSKIHKKHIRRVLGILGGGVNLPTFLEPIGGALQWLFSAFVPISTVKADGYTYIRDNANKGNVRLQKQGFARDYDGVDGVTTIGNVGNTQYTQVWVKQVIDNQILFSLANSTATAVSVVAGVLTFGGSITIGSIFIDGVSKTASEAGVILNDNLPHLFYIDYTQIATSNLALAYDGTTYGNINLFDFRVGDTTEPVGDILNVISNPNYLHNTETGIWHLDEEAGTTSFDSIGGNHGVDTGGVTHVNQDVVSWPNKVGNSPWGINDGVAGSRVELDSLITISGEFEINIDFIWNGTLEYLFSNYSGTTDNLRVSAAGTTAQFRINSTTNTFTYITPLIEGNRYTLKATRDGDDLIRVYIDDVEASGATTDATDVLVLSLAQRAVGDTSLTTFKSVEVVGVGKWTAANNWQDEVGPNNGTASGIDTFQAPALLDSSTPSTDIFGESLTYSGSAPKDGKLIQSHAVTFDGVGDDIQFSDITLTAGQLWSIEGWVYCPDTGANRLLGGFSSNDYVIINIVTDEIWIRSSVGGLVQLGYTAGLIQQNTWHNIKIIHNVDDTVDLIVDDVLVSDIGTQDEDVTVRYLARGSSAYAQYRLANMKLESNGATVFHYPLAEGAGLIAYDVSGNGNNGIITGTEGAIWANTQDLYHTNILSGYSLYEHTTSDPIKVPYTSGAPSVITPPSGYTLTENRPAGKYHNGAETKVNTNPLSDPELIYRGGIPVDNEIHPTDTFVSPEFMNDTVVKKSENYAVYDKNITTEQEDLINEAIEL